MMAKRAGFALCVLVWGTVQAQVPNVPLPKLEGVPDAGRTSQEVETGEPPFTPVIAPNIDLQGLPAPTAASAPDSTTSAATVRVQSFRFSGNTVISEARLQTEVAAFVGQDLTLAALQGVAERITALYRRENYFLAQAFLPVQTISDGVIELRIEEGRLGELTLNNSSRIPDARILAIMRAQGCPYATSCKNRVMRIDRLETALLNLSNLAGIDSQATLSAGTEPGTSDLQIKVSPRARRVSGSTGVDNFGNAYTGRNRLRFAAEVQNPSNTWGDLLSARGLTSGRGLQNLAVNYSVPVSARGTRLGLEASRVTYELGGAFAATDTSGSADVLSLIATHPLILRLDRSVMLSVSLNDKKLEDDYGGVVSFDKHAKTLVAGLSGQYRNLGPRNGGAGSYEVQATAGHLSLDEASAANDELTARTAGHFARLNFSVAHQQRLSGSWAVYGALRGQIASKNLDSSERFFLGGPDAVRAYASGRGSGDEGALATLELRYLLPNFYTLPGQLSLMAFWDGGWVNVNKAAWPLYTGPEHRILSGAGVGVSWYGANGVSLTANLASRQNNNDAIADDARTHLWLTAGVAF